MDLKESFDRALDGGPAHAPIQHRLIAGRRAVRNRRTAIGASVLATVLVLGGAGWAALPGTVDAVDESVSAPPANTLTPTAATQSPAQPYSPPMFMLDHNTGALETVPGLTIQRRVEDPVDRPGVKSVAAIATYKDETWWVMSAIRPGISGWGDEHRATSTRTFEQWVQDLAVLNNGSRFTNMDERSWVTLGKDGELTPSTGVTIIEQSTPARIDQAPAGVPSATGTIEVDGARLCVIARILFDEDPDIVYFAESENEGCGDAVVGYAYESDAP